MATLTVEQRVAKERDDLAAKLEKLVPALSDPEVPAVQRHLMREQKWHMESYLRTLEARLEALAKSG